MARSRASFIKVGGLPSVGTGPQILLNREGEKDRYGPSVLRGLGSIKGLVL